MSKSVPKKFLAISNLVFVIPDDFEGNIKDALILLLNYVVNSLNGDNEANEVNDEEGSDSIMKKLIELNFADNVSMQFSFFQFDDDIQQYVSTDKIINENKKN